MSTAPDDPGAPDGDGVVDNGAESRFELAVGERVAYAQYQRRPGLLVVQFVYAPPSLRGTGASNRLMEGVAARARAEARRIVPACGYASRWLHLHERHRNLIA